MTGTSATLLSGSCVCNRGRVLAKRLEWTDFGAHKMRVRVENFEIEKRDRADNYLLRCEVDRCRVVAIAAAHVAVAFEPVAELFAPLKARIVLWPVRAGVLQVGQQWYLSGEQHRRCPAIELRTSTDRFGKIRFHVLVRRVCFNGDHRIHISPTQVERMLTAQLA